MKDLFKNTFLLHGKKTFTGRGLKKYIKNGLYKPENQFPQPGTKHSLKNTFPLYEMLLLARKPKKMVSTSRKMFFFENWLLFLGNNCF